MLPAENKRLHQTIARNMTDKELAHRIDADGDACLPEYKEEALRRFAQELPDASKELIQEDLFDAFSTDSLKEACDELQAELDEGREWL